MSELVLARDLVFILLTAFIGGVIAKKLKLPLIVGYLTSGMLINSVLSRFYPLGIGIKNIAEIGVALLLFTLGLEFSLQKLKEYSDVIFYGAFIQIILTTLFSTVILPILGLDFWTSLFFGAVFSLSSTAIVIKTLFDYGELESLHGEISAGWLFMQDLMTLPLMILLPTLGKMLKQGNFGLGQFSVLSGNIFFAVISFFLIIYLGKRVVPKIIEFVADIKSRELTLIASVSICLLFSFLFQYFGFSFAIGAFVAGVLMSTSSAYHNIFAEIRPLRDLFSIVFFVSLGFLVNPIFLLTHWQIILSISIIIILLKILISSTIMLFMGFHTKTAALVSLALISVGEFGFIMALEAEASQLISTQDYMIIISVSFITLIVSTPLLVSGHYLYSALRHFIKNKFPSLINLFDHFDKKEWLISEPLSDHVVVLGHGRVGKYICRALSFVEIPYVVVDYDHQLVKNLKDEGIKVIYGDPTDIDVLQFANVKNAKVIILAYNDRHMQQTVVANIFSLNSNIKLICRTHHEEDQKKLKSLGVEIVIQPEFEAAISMTEKLLQLFNVSEDIIYGKIKRLKIEHGQ